MIPLWLSEEEFFALCYCVDYTLQLVPQAEAEAMRERGRDGVVGMVEKMTVELHRLGTYDDA